MTSRLLRVPRGEVAFTGACGHMQQGGGPRRHKQSGRRRAEAGVQVGGGMCVGGTCLSVAEVQFGENFEGRMRRLEFAPISPS